MTLPLPKHQGGFGLGFVVAGRRAADEHGGATVPTQGVLQDAGHFAVTIRDVGFLEAEEQVMMSRKAIPCFSILDSIELR